MGYKRITEVLEASVIFFFIKIEGTPTCWGATRFEDYNNHIAGAPRLYIADLKLVVGKAKPLQLGKVLYKKF